MINKMKIDLLMNRQPSSMNFTNYLSLINDTPPEEFDYIDDLFLADLFSIHEENLEFFKQVSV